MNESQFQCVKVNQKMFCPSLVLQTHQHPITGYIKEMKIPKFVPSKTHSTLVQYPEMLGLAVGKKSILFASMDLFITKQTKGNKIDYQHIMCHFIQNDFSSYFPFLYRFNRKDNEIQPQRPRHTSQTKDNHNVVALQFMNAFLMFFIFVSSCFICVVLCIIFTSKKCFFISLFSLLAERKKLHNPRAT